MLGRPGPPSRLPSYFARLIFDAGQESFGCDHGGHLEKEPAADSSGRGDETQTSRQILENWAELAQIEALLSLRIGGPPRAGPRFRPYHPVSSQEFSIALRGTALLTALCRPDESSTRSAAAGSGHSQSYGSRNWRKYATSVALSPVPSR